VVDALTVDVGEISRRERTTQTLSLDAGRLHAGQEYVFLGTASGTEPGFEFAGLRIPINPDLYTRLLVLCPRQSPVTPLRGFLDGAGRATATFALDRRWHSALLVGHTFHHAFVVLDGQRRVVFVSNAAQVTVRR